jgi:hypothetical protein
MNTSQSPKKGPKAEAQRPASNSPDAGPPAQPVLQQASPQTSQVPPGQRDLDVQGPPVAGQAPTTEPAIGAAPSGGTVIDNAENLTQQDQQFIDDLDDFWQQCKAEQADLSRKSHTVELSARHEIGKRINDNYGPPTLRQPRGERVIAILGERLGMKKEEISRERNFALTFPDFDQFQEQHPDVKSWSAVKRLMKELKTSSGAQAPAATTASGAKGRGKKAPPEPNHAAEFLTFLRQAVGVLPNARGSLTLAQLVEAGNLARTVLTELGLALEPVRTSILEPHPDPAVWTGGHDVTHSDPANRPGPRDVTLTVPTAVVTSQ